MFPLIRRDDMQINFKYAGKMKAISIAMRAIYLSLYLDINIPMWLWKLSFAPRFNILLSLDMNWIE